MTRPCVGLSMPAIRCRSVDLPDPLGPIRATNSPRSTVRSTFSSAVTCTWPRTNSLLRFTAWTIGSGTCRSLALGLDLVAVVQSGWRCDDQIFAADQALADFDFAGRRTLAEFD